MRQRGRGWQTSLRVVCLCACGGTAQGILQVARGEHRHVIEGGQSRRCGASRAHVVPERRHGPSGAQRVAQSGRRGRAVGDPQFQPRCAAWQRNSATGGTGVQSALAPAMPLRTGRGTRGGAQWETYVAAGTPAARRWAAPAPPAPRAARRRPPPRRRIVCGRGESPPRARHGRPVRRGTRAAAAARDPAWPSRGRGSAALRCALSAARAAPRVHAPRGCAWGTGRGRWVTVVFK